MVHLNILTYIVMKNRKVKKAIFRSKSEYDLIFCLFKKQIKTVCTCPCVCVYALCLEGHIPLREEV